MLHTFGKMYQVMILFLTHFIVSFDSTEQQNVTDSQILRSSYDYVTVRVRYERK